MKIIERYAVLYLKLGDIEFGPGDIINIFRVTENNAKVIISRMLKKGMIRRTNTGRYVLLGPSEFMIKSSFGRDIVGFMEAVYGKKYYITGPSALSQYGLASSGDYYITVEDENPAAIFSRSSGIEIKTQKRQIREGNYKRTVFEGKNTNVAKIEVAIAETLLMEPDIIQFYAIPAVCEYLERGYGPDLILKASRETGVLNYMKKILRVLADNGFNVPNAPEIRLEKKEREFIAGGINV
jgi:hypothetical protein